MAKDNDDALDVNSLAEKIISNFNPIDILNNELTESDKKALYLIPGSLGLLACDATLIFSENIDKSSFIILLIASVSALFSFLLSWWYVGRLKLRISKFKKKQEDILKKAKEQIIKVLELVKELIQYKVKADILGDGKEAGTEEDIEYYMSKAQFMTTIVMQLAAKETSLNSKKSFVESLDENFSTIKLVIDYLSDKLRVPLFFMSVIFMTSAMFIKFLSS